VGKEGSERKEPVVGERRPAWGRQEGARCRMRVVVACMNPGAAFRLSDVVKFQFMEASRRQVSFREQWKTAGHWPEPELVRSVRNGGFPLQSDVLRRRRVGASSKGVLTSICLCGVCTSAVLEGALFFWEDGQDKSETGEQQTAQLPVTSPSNRTDLGLRPPVGIKQFSVRWSTQIRVRTTSRTAN
jgi:hypothetical protein